MPKFSKSGLVAALTMLCLRTAAYADSPSVSSLEWVHLPTSVAPSARQFPAMAYDPISHKVILFGGWNGATYRNDTWTFDGSTWTEITPATGQPPARSNAGIAFDSPTGKLVLFGGYNGSQYLSDTWLWDGATSTWTDAHAATAPAGVTTPCVFPDPANGHADTFGGYDGRFYQLQTWQWTGATWRNLDPASSPTARSAAVCAFDRATRTVVLFDGLADVNPYNTWTWDGVNWTEQSPASMPPSLYNSPGFYVPAIHAVVSFGGAHSGVEINDTWAWTGSDWYLLHPANPPSPRESYGAALFGDVPLLFGGAANGQLLNETWILAAH